ncbi:AMP-dependent synthetase [Gemmatimonadetes bacterium T265]|nr:AMP-dependent synthetase [Gemmatimonadetes bacterium T265]
MTIHALLVERARECGAAPALRSVGAPARAPLTFASLLAHVERAATALRGAGVRRGDAVALVLPNGPEAATAFLAAAAAATAAPLNPAYGAAELASAFDDLRPRVLVVPRAGGAAARGVAAERGVRVLTLDVPDGAPAGAFTLDGVPPGAAGGGAAPAAPDDVALVLHTSGTTSRAKVVPLTHANLTASARHVADALALTPADRCLNVMPLFHIHGLVAALLASIAAGAGVACAPGFEAPRFFAWWDEVAPTWYTAVPTMHQAVLERAAAHAAVIARRPIRFARSSSAPLAPATMAGLERALGAPVVEAYGMTEAAHQMTSSPLPPGARKPGSVGRAAGPAVAVLDAAGAAVPAGTLGEVAVRGPNVMGGYRGAPGPDANARAFAGGWFRTGDQGYLDEDGYLFLTGRLKELVNRGGEKIAPREVDEVLAAHPAVAQAVAFAAPHATLGEVVAAAVVPRPGADVTEEALRRFVAARLAPFKVPRRVLLVPAIPTGPTGKPQRVGLAAALGLTAPLRDDDDAPAAAYVAPTTATEALVAGLCAAVLGVDRVGADDNFFALGGDSVLATQLVARVADAVGRDLPPFAFFEAPTVRALAAAADVAAADAAGGVP